MTPSKTEDTFPGGESIDGNLCFCLRVVFSRLFIIHPNVIHAQGIFSKNKQHKSNMLANQLDLSSSCLNYYPPRFVNVTLPIQTRLLRNAMSHTTPIDPDLNQDFSINELLSAINDTKNTTSGPDNICYEMFKLMSIKYLQVMLQLFNTIWFTGKIPPSWLHSILVPVPKPNKPAHLPSSYRPISLTSNACKLFEKMIVCRLNLILEYHNVLQISFCEIRIFLFFQKVFTSQ